MTAPSRQPDSDGPPEIGAAWGAAAGELLASLRRRRAASGPGAASGVLAWCVPRASCRRPWAALAWSLGPRPGECRQRGIQGMRSKMKFFRTE